MNHNSIYLRRRWKILLSPPEVPVSPPPEYLSAFQKNLESLGFILSPALAEAILAMPLEKMGKVYHQLIADLKTLVGAHVNFKPMYPNFPEQVRNTPQLALYLNALLHYWGDAIGQRILPHYDKQPRPELQDQYKLKVIDLGTKEEFNQIFTQLLQAKTSLSATDRLDMEWFVKNRGESITALIPEEIPLRENIAQLGAYLIRYTDQATNFLQQHIKTATDILRLAVALSQGDISLAEPTKFISFPQKQRRLLMALLDKIKQPVEDMLRFPEPWKRLGERLHPFEYQKQWPEACKAFDIIRNKKPYPTFANQVEKAMAQKDIETAVNLLRQRPGEMARRLDWLLRLDKQPELILKAFSAVAPKVSTPVLLQVYTHFLHRSDPPELRIFFPKGNLAKIQAIENTLPPLNTDISLQVMEICWQTLFNRFRQLPTLGHVYLSSTLRNYTVPFALRSASKSLKTIARGSRIELSDGDTIRFFIWWKDGVSRTDLDLSALALNNDHHYKSTIAYYNLKALGGYHSGDITSAPQGASEFIDIHIPTFIKANIRYVLMVVNSYTQQAYCDLPECFAGFMMRQCPNSGEIYDPRTVANKFDLTANTEIAIPLILDLYTHQVLWTDLALTRNPSANNNVHQNLSSLTLLSRAMQDLRKPSLYDLFELHLKARGTRVDTPEKADTIFAIDQGITPFDTLKIISGFL